MITLKQGEKQELKDADRFALLPHLWFKVNICHKEATDDATTTESEGLGDTSHNQTVSDPTVTSQSTAVASATFGSKRKQGDDATDEVPSKSAKLDARAEGEAQNVSTSSEDDVQLRLSEAVEDVQENDVTVKVEAAEPSNTEIQIPDNGDNEVDVNDDTAVKLEDDVPANDNVRPEDVTSSEPAKPEAADDNEDKKKNDASNQAGPSNVRPHRDRCWYGPSCYR